MFELIIYLIGFILSYIILRRIDLYYSSKINEERTWGDVLATFFIAIFSWFSIFMGTIVLIVVGIIKLYKFLHKRFNININLEKPPKWL